MATPAIQTLLTDAQQVLNLNSLSEVRSTMAAALANANVGTPLNPNLTTQQLWDEFYLIVRQPESDIESIITNQLMKFLFAPPAPGGAGADQQVIFNDGGVLAGDPQFLWNKTTNLLTVTGSAAITGDLTVRTTRLTTTTTGVGIGTAAPILPLDVRGTAGAGALFLRTTDPTAAVASAYIQTPVSTGFSSTVPIYGFWYQNSGMGNPAADTLNWIIGSAEAMRLNSTANLVLKGGTVAANGVGVTFPATQVASSDANCLDDYEEGTFTATFNGSTTNPTVPLTAPGRYTKIGRQVSISIKVGGSTVGASGRIQIEGLPFANNSSIEAIAFVGFDGMGAFTGSPFGVVVANGTIIYMQSSISSTAYGQVTFNAGVSQNAWVSLTYSV